MGLSSYVSLTKFIEFTQVDLLSLAVLQVNMKSRASQSEPADLGFL